MERFHLQEVDPGVIEVERNRVLALLHSTVPRERVHEVGSTAVPGVIGKQDLDFLVLVSSEEFEATRSELDKQFRKDQDQIHGRSMDEYRDAKREFIERALSTAGTRDG